MEVLRGSQQSTFSCIVSFCKGTMGGFPSYDHTRECPLAPALPDPTCRDLVACVVLSYAPGSSRFTSVCIVEEQCSGRQTGRLDGSQVIIGDLSSVCHTLTSSDAREHRRSWRAMVTHLGGGLPLTSSTLLPCGATSTV